MRTRIIWTEEEIVLALEAAMRFDWRGVNLETPVVVELSQQLRAASIHPVLERPENFRTPGSVGMKINNLRAGRSENGGRGLRSTAVERAIVELYAQNEQALRARADFIRTKYAMASLQSVK